VSQSNKSTVQVGFCAVIVWAASFTSTSWRRDEVFAPYTIARKSSTRFPGLIVP
jgi:hypothetical protein